MPALSTPELIIPGELYIPDDGLESILQVNAAALPNGDDALQWNWATGVSNRFEAYQAAPADATPPLGDHLMLQAGCAMSFWIRRRADFAAPAVPVAFTDPGNVGTIPADVGIIMSVSDPTATEFNAAQRSQWAFTVFSATQIQFIQGGYRYLSAGNQGYSRNPVGAAIDLPLNEWVFITVVVTAFNNALTGQQGKALLYRNAQYLGAASSPASWSYYVNPLNPYRFALGDPTLAERSVTGTGADGPLFDIGKLCFHGQTLTVTEMLSLYESMLYGPASP